MGKTSDMFNAWGHGIKKDYDGYVLGNIGISEDGDYIKFKYCLECGKIQGKFPISDETLKKELKERLGEEDEYPEEEVAIGLDWEFRD